MQESLHGIRRKDKLLFYRLSFIIEIAGIFSGKRNQDDVRRENEPTTYLAGRSTDLPS